MTPNGKLAVRVGLSTMCLAMARVYDFTEGSNICEHVLRLLVATTGDSRVTTARAIASVKALTLELRKSLLDSAGCIVPEGCLDAFAPEERAEMSELSRSFVDMSGMLLTQERLIIDALREEPKVFS